MNDARPAPQRMSAPDRQQQLLEAALSVFSRKGFKGATTREIAAAAGVTEAIIFQHFPSKEALYSAVLELHFDTGDEDSWREQVQACMERSDDEGLAIVFIRRILEAYVNDTALQRVILFAALEGHGQGLARMKEQYAATFEKLVAYIRRRQREGALVDGDPHTLLIALGALAHQYGQITRIMNAPVLDLPDEELARQFARILLGGIRKAPAPAGRKGRGGANPSHRKAKS
jgi:TetR/AcrR family transcriptional regulator